LEKLQKETAAMQTLLEDVTRKRKAKEDLLKEIEEWEAKKLACQTKIEELKKLDSDLFE